MGSSLRSTLAEVIKCITSLLNRPRDKFDLKKSEFNLRNDEFDEVNLICRDLQKYSNLERKTRTDYTHTHTQHFIFITSSGNVHSRNHPDNFPNRIDRPFVPRNKDSTRGAGWRNRETEKREKGGEEKAIECSAYLNVSDQIVP